MEDIEERVDLLIGSPKAAIPPRKKHRMLRMIGAGGSSLGIIKGLLLFTVTAALISTIIGSFIVSQQMNIPLEGREAYDLFVDGVAVGADDFLMNPDEFSDGKLTWGETETFQHTFMSPEFNGNFDIYWSQDWQTWRTTPSAEFYGYNFTTTDINDEPITSISVMNGTTVTVNFVHFLNNHFAATDNPLPFDFQMHVVEYVAPPQCNPDTYSVNWRTETDLNVLANDLPTGLTITAVSGGGLGDIITIGEDANHVHVYQNTIGTTTYHYTADSGAPLHKLGTGTITVTAS